MPDDQNKKEMKRINVAVKHLKTFVHLYKAANIAVEKAQTDLDDNFYNSMSCILFCALCLEAYLNHVGAEEFQFWEDDLESLNPMAKLRLIASERLETEAIPINGFPQKRKPIKLSIDFSRRPFQSFSVIFNIRNQLAHGKTQWILEEHPNQPKAKWEKYCTTQQAKQFLKDTEEMIKTLHSKLYDTTHDPFTEDLNFFGSINV
ncbi:MAG: hypothetical protein KF758_15390 [Anaerolineales bacterium]|nr:hypothetical protein [Anaerolineales bacterium]